MANKAKKKQAKKAIKTVAKKPAKKAVKKVTAKVAKKPAKKVIAKKSVAKKVIAKKAAPSAVVKSAKATVKNIDYSKAITPLADRLVIRVVQGEKVTAGGIIIPDMVHSATGHLKGEVLAAGNGAKNKKGAIRPLDVKIGDQILFSEHAGTKVIFNSEELQIIHESDVMGIVQK
ncbi:MAG: co-chaperone GroES [Pseudobdellovibrio sp.]